MIKRTIIIFGVYGIEWALACATCYGAPDAPETHGMNGAIWTLLVITGGVLSSIVAGYISIRRKTKEYLNNQEN